MTATLVVLAVLAAACLVLLPMSFGRRMAEGSRAVAAVTLVLLLTGLAAAALLAVDAPPASAPSAVVAITLLLAVAATGGSPAATAVLRLSGGAAAAKGEALSGAVDLVPSPATPELLAGGEWLGVLERVAVFGTLALDAPELTALVLGVKGIGRFGELRTPAAPERFMIGTLASVLWAGGCYAVSVAVLR